MDAVRTTRINGWRHVWECCGTQFAVLQASTSRKIKSQLSMEKCHMLPWFNFCALVACHSSSCFASCLHLLSGYRSRTEVVLHRTIDRPGVRRISYANFDPFRHRRCHDSFPLHECCQHLSVASTLSMLPPFPLLSMILIGDLTVAAAS